MQPWHPIALEAFGRLRAEELRREADEWRAARLAVLLAAPPARRRRGRLAEALAWCRSHLLRRHEEQTSLAEQEP